MPPSLSLQKKNIFIDSLYLESRESLTKELEIKGGIEATRFRTLFDRVYKERHEEYGKHAFGNLSPEEAWGEKDTLYRIFGEQIVDLLDLEVDLATDNHIQSLYVVAYIPMGLTRKLLTLGSSFESDKIERDGEIDFSKRILCSDGNCIGVINDKGVCNVCGRPESKSDKSEVV